MTAGSLVIYLCAPEYRERAERLSQRLGAPLVSAPPDPETLTLRFDADGVSLCCGKLSVRGDLTRMIPRLRPANLRGELLVRAASVKNADRPLTAVDATAGLGEDSLLLAASGFAVTLCERDPVIAALLSDSVERAREIPDLRGAASRMTVVECDGAEYMRGLGNAPDVVFLDPMFPERTKSGLIKKKLRLIQRLESPCEDESGLFEAAKSAGPRKIVIKRPLKGPYLAGVKPSHSLFGKAIRYDCVVLR